MIRSHSLFRKLILISALLLICCADNSDEDMKLFVNSLGNQRVAPIAGTIHVILLTGQSNAVGFAKNTDALASELDETSVVKIWQKDADFANLNIAADNNYARAGLGEHGIELGLAEYLNTNIYMIKWGVGSTSITQHIPGGAVYEEFYNNFVVPGLARLAELHPTATINKYLVYWQGEADSTTSGLASYPARLDTWVDAWQTNLGSDIPIRVFEIAEDNATRAAINDVFHAKAATEANMEVIYTQDLQLDDFQHFGYQGKKDAAQRLITSLPFS